MNIEINRYVCLILPGIGRRPGNMGDAMMVIYGRKACTVAERLRAKVSESQMPSYERNSEKIELRVSVGIAEATLSMSSLETLLKLADQALYRAKIAGRNCIVASEPAEKLLNAAAE